MKYFIYVEGDTTYWYTSEEEYIKARDGFDFLGTFCDEGWDSDVECCMAGAVPESVVLDPDDSEHDQLEPFATHQAESINRRERPSEEHLDDCGYDQEGTYWGEWDYICDYHFAPIVSERASEYPPNPHPAKND